MINNVRRRNIMYNFQSDYLEGCAPEILEELIKVNQKQSVGYGEDEYCAEAAELIKEKIGRNNLDVHFIPGGTPCNVLAISSSLKPYEAVIAAETGHISIHETGAIEASGHKIITVKHEDGKVTPENISKVCNAHSDEHMVKPAMVFISNPTEFGSIYSLAELKALRNVCDKYGLYLYLDGARLASALAIYEYDVTLSDIADLCDIFYIGGTKNGALLGEAMVIVNDKLKDNFRYMEKQRGQMLAKGRILGITFKTLFIDDLYLKLARHANKTANALRYVFNAFNIKEFIASPTNQTFVILENDVVKKLHENYLFNEWDKYDENHTVCRFVTSWCTKEDAILEFSEDLRKAIKK